MKKVLKIVVIIFFIFIIGMMLLVQYIKSESNTGVSKMDFQEIVQSIKNAPPLPEKFIAEYVKIDDTLSLNEKLFYDFTHSDYKSCPCYRLTNMLIPIYSKSKPNKFHLKTKNMGLALNLEKKVSQKECLQFLIYRFDFLYGNKGIETASQYYFHINPDKLSTKEIRTFIVMLKNPIWFNPIDHPEQLQSELEEIEKRMEE